MQQPPIIERAFQLARECEDIESIRATLRKEGYESVQAHLSGAVIRNDLKRVFARHAAA